MNSPAKYAYFHSPGFAEYNFGGGHAFNPIRQELTVDLAMRARLLRDEHRFEPRPADVDEIALFHSEEYIRAVQAAGQAAGTGAAQASYLRYGLGTRDNPIFRGMHEATALRVGATLDATRGVMEGRFAHAVNFGGGLHHAARARASGFCIYNDIGVAIAYLRRRYDCKVAYVDLDAHHGDGVQWGFYSDPDVLTVSIHESGRFLFPGTGGVEEIGEGDAQGSSVNIPLLPHTTSESWLECFMRVVPEVVEAFQPDVLITQHGCDAHRLDPLTHLQVSVEALDAACQVLHRLAHELCGGRWVALGGGGYAIWQVVPRAWALVWARLTDQTADGRLPEDWCRRWQGSAPVPLPAHWYDAVDQSPPKDSADMEAAWRAEQNRAAAEQARTSTLKALKKRRS